MATKTKKGRTGPGGIAHGDECPVCRCGTVEVQAGGVTVCRGECGQFIDEYDVRNARERAALADLVKEGALTIGAPGSVSRSARFELHRRDADFFRNAIKAGVGSHIGWDWHEPDQIEVDAVVAGRTFDNAGVEGEKLVHLKVDGKRVAEINLASLCALAMGAVLRLQAPREDTK